MSRTVKLHGGPWHGQLVSVEDNRDHIHVVTPIMQPPTRLMDPVRHPDATLPTREGTYSQVQGEPNDFEWDGWVSRD